jgi:hypothetical protein
MRRNAGCDQRRIDNDRGTADDGCDDPRDDANAGQKGDRQNVTVGEFGVQLPWPGLSRPFRLSRHEDQKNA